MIRKQKHITCNNLVVCLNWNLKQLGNYNPIEKIKNSNATQLKLYFIKKLEKSMKKTKKTKDWDLIHCLV